MRAGTLMGACARIEICPLCTPAAGYVRSMTGKPVRRRMFDRRSGVDRRRRDVRIYWPDRRRGDRRRGEDRRRVKPVPTRRGMVGEGRKLTAAARDWLERLTR